MAVAPEPKMSRQSDLETKTTGALETIVANSERLGKTSDVRYVNARKILGERKNGDYNIEKTITLIRQHGKLGSFLCFKDVADASGLNWAQSRRKVNSHLDTVNDHTIAKSWPLLTAIIVNKENIGDGEMTPANLKGFLLAVQKMGVELDIDDIAFVKREQQRVFEWCQKEHTP